MEKIIKQISEEILMEILELNHIIELGIKKHLVNIVVIRLFASLIKLQKIIITTYQMLIKKKLLEKICQE